MIGNGFYFFLKERLEAPLHAFICLYSDLASFENCARIIIYVDGWIGLGWTLIGSRCWLYRSSVSMYVYFKVEQCKGVDMKPRWFAYGSENGGRGYFHFIRCCWKSLLIFCTEYCMTWNYFFNAVILLFLNIIIRLPELMSHEFETILFN